MSDNRLPARIFTDYSDCQHLVSLSKFDGSMDRVMRHLWNYLGVDGKRGVIPTLIGISIEPGPDASCLPMIRNFLNLLPRLYERHFVRFVSNIFTITQSNYGDRFYSYESAKTHVCDVTWHVRPIGPGQFDIRQQVRTDPNKLGLLSNLSKEFTTSLGMGNNGTHQNKLSRIMKNFYKNSKYFSQVSEFKSDFHVLFIPSTTGNRFYPIPLHGFSYFDAQRRFLEVTRQQEMKHHAYCFESFAGVFPKEVDSGQIIYSLLEMIQDTGYFTNTSALTKEAYELAELLFGWYATYSHSNRSTNDLILFDKVDSTRRTIDMYHYSLSEMNKVA